jgi:hypothetical protein
MVSIQVDKNYNNTGLLHLGRNNDKNLLAFELLSDFRFLASPAPFFILSFSCRNQNHTCEIIKLLLNKSFQKNEYLIGRRSPLWDCRWKDWTGSTDPTRSAHPLASRTGNHVGKWSRYFRRCSGLKIKRKIK